MPNISESEPLLIGTTTIPETVGATGGGSGGDKESVTVPMVVPISELASTVPRHGAPYTGDLAVLGTALGFSSYRVKKKVGDLVHLELTYAVNPDGSAGSTGDGTNPDGSPGGPGGANPPAVPDDEITGNSSGLEIPIPRHPLFETVSATLDGDSLADHWDDNLGRLVFPSGHPAIALGLQGMSSYIVGSYQVTHTEYFNGSPTTLVGVVGTKGVPPGEDGTEDNWLIVSGSKQEPNSNSPFGMRTLTYLYSDAPGFPEGIYT